MPEIEISAKKESPRFGIFERSFHVLIKQPLKPLELHFDVQNNIYPREISNAFLMTI